MATITEVAQNVDRRFLKIDQLFKEIKQQKKINQINSTLIKIETKLSKIFDVNILIQADYIGQDIDNVICIPVLKKGKLWTTDLSLNDVDSINIILGYDIIRNNTPSQLTAIMLHEIGHVANHLKGFSLSVDQFFKHLGPAGQLINLLPIIGVIFFIVKLGGLKITSRLKEYKADAYAVKYGYGDELMQALHKLDKTGRQARSEASILTRLLNTINDFLSKFHPSKEARIKQIYNDIISEYSNQYKSKKITNIMNKYKIK
jgi:hypothetical protein